LERTTKAVTGGGGDPNGNSSFCNAVTGKRDEVHDGRRGSRTPTAANLTDAHLTDASLTDAGFWGATLTGANLTGATLTGVLSTRLSERRHLCPLIGLSSTVI
jgi:uncharacterized protein YjbI with pentapeptide repeats